MTQHSDELARINFEAYRMTAEGQTHDGKPIPEWDELGEQTRNNWRAGTEAVITSKPGFIAAFTYVQEMAHRIAESKGWWDGGERNFGETTALIHSELSEALEAKRHGNPPSDHIPAFSGVEEEWADVVIREMDVASVDGYRLAEAIWAKLMFNAGRPYKHGGKAF